MNFEQNNVVEFSLLDKNFLSKYNLEQTEENVLEIISNYLKAQYKYIDIIPPRMTSNYEVKYESFNKFNANDTVGKHIEEKIDADEISNIIKMENQLKSFVNKINTVKDQIEYTKKQLRDAREELNKPFTNQEMIRKLQKEKARIDSELDLDKQENVKSVEKTTESEMEK